MSALPSTRRGFLFGISAVAGGIALGGLPSAAHDMGDLSLFNDHPEITVWVVIHPDDAVIIRVARSEMGQGSLTALPMLVAEELECDWSRVQPEYVPPAVNLARGRAWGPMVTVGSLSIRTSHEYLRKAGAQARLMLIAEAAARWGVSAIECTVSNSVVTHLPSARTIRYGEIADAASKRPVPGDVTLKDPKTWHLIGQPVRRFDMVEKSMGSQSMRAMSCCRACSTRQLLNARPMAAGC
jgi:isoquinoline 1-oxidoreductase subunit beta